MCILWDKKKKQREYWAVKNTCAAENEGSKSLQSTECRRLQTSQYLQLGVRSLKRWHIVNIPAYILSLSCTWQMQKHKRQMLQPCISIFFQHLWVIKSNKQQVFKHRLGLKVIRPIAVMTPTESCRQDGVSVTPSHHFSQSQQQLVLLVNSPPNTICPNP